MTVAGKVELSQSEDRLSVFIGVGKLGWSRTFLWSDFSSAREDGRRNGFNWNGQGRVVVMEGKRRVAFGSMWNEEKRYFVLSALGKCSGGRTVCTHQRQRRRYFGDCWSGL